jgi:arylsulfatase A-like enzyme
MKNEEALAQRVVTVSLSLLFALSVSSCGEAGSRRVLTAGVPLHFEEYLDHARVIGSDVPEHDLQPIAWQFDVQQPDWKVVGDPQWPEEVPQLEWTGTSLRATISEENRLPFGLTSGALYAPVPNLRRSDWADVVIRARARGAVEYIRMFYNVRYLAPQGDSLLANARQIDFGTGPRDVWFLSLGEETFVVPDGNVHTYRISVDTPSPEGFEWFDPWRELIILFGAQSDESDGELEILSVSIVPKLARYSELTGVRLEGREEYYRRTLYMHAPGRLEYDVRVPPDGRLDAALAVPLSDMPVTFRVTAKSEDGTETSLLERSLSDAEAWSPATADLSEFADETVTLALEAESDSVGAVALWGAPTLSGARPGRPDDRPNVILYVIDAAGADFMSVYGYDRKTTPNLERLAAEGAVIDHAYSNSAWTRPSTASFLTSLQQSILGVGNFDSLPPGVVTMHEHFHRAGYQTATITSNAWAGRLSTQGREIDFLRDLEPELASTSSAALHDDFWSWREAFPGQPYFVHFQTTDVHEPHRPVEPFAGRYVSAARRDSFDVWWPRLFEVDGPDYERTGDVSGAFRARLATIGVDPTVFFTLQRDLYDETMAHQDHQLDELVERLKATGEWENTLLIISSDHGHPAGSYSRFGRELLDPRPEEWEGALLDSYRTHVPLVVIWPGHIPAGQRISEPVSLLDVLPTVLELADLPPPDVMQGQSLVPLLTGTKGWKTRPIIFEQYQIDPRNGLVSGHIEVLDGRWGASLTVHPELHDTVDFRPDGIQRAARLFFPDKPRLLLYDVWEDPLATRNVNDQHPELAEKYTQFLLEQIEAHQALAQHFTPGGEVELTPEQIETLRSLGYIQ